jgi:Arc/MetJ-type ribon-helix-helix transcriptional regulator
MEIRPSPNQEALIRQAVEAGRFEQPEDAVKEALALWEEREHARAAFRETLDEAETSLVRGEGTEITRKSMRELTDGIMERTGARLAAEQKATR